MDPLLIVCAWCGQQPASPTVELVDVPVSHGICAACAEDGGFDAIDDLHALSEAEYDALPFGAIELDRTGVVLAYNEAEEARSGRDRSRVVGRNFFTEVAPCTRVKQFRGAYDRMVQNDTTGHARFDFVFPFEDGDCRVTVALTYDTATGRGLVLVQDAGAE